MRLACVPLWLLHQTRLWASLQISCYGQPRLAMPLPGAHTHIPCSPTRCHSPPPPLLHSDAYLGTGLVSMSGSGLARALAAEERTVQRACCLTPRLMVGPQRGVGIAESHRTLLWRRGYTVHTPTEHHTQPSRHSPPPSPSTHRSSTPPTMTVEALTRQSTSLQHRRTC